MKIRLSTVIIYSAAILAGTALMYTSQRVQESERELRNLQIGRDDARDHLHMLNAEWAYLTRPERLEQLAVQYLPALAPMSPDRLRDDYNFQMPVIDEIPSGPTMMPQEAAVTVGGPVAGKQAAPSAAETVVDETPVAAPMPAEDMALVPTSPSPIAASSAVPSSHAATAAYSAPQAPAMTAAAIAPSAGHPSPGADFSQLLTRMTANEPTPDGRGQAGGR